MSVFLSVALIVAFAIFLSVIVITCLHFYVEHKYPYEKLKRKQNDEFKEWLTKRRANMTQAQRESEDLHFSQLRAMPPSKVFEPRTGNSLSKDLLGFDLLSK